MQYNDSDTQTCNLCGNTYQVLLRSFHDSTCIGKHLGEKYVWNGQELTPQQEKAEVEAIAEADRIEVNRPYYVLSNPWYLAWREYVDGGGARPPPINNGELVESQDGDSVTVKKGLAADYDYKVVPGLVWQRLVAWYGGRPEIMRQAIRLGTQLVVDLHPVEVSGVYENQQIRLSLSSSNPFRMVRHWVATSVNCAPHRTELYVLSAKEDGTEERRLLSKEDLKQTMDDAGVGTQLRVELVGIPQDVSTSVLAGLSSHSSYGAYRPPESERGQPLARGIVGLYNLGNTCFLNSILQGLSAVPAFTSLFLNAERYASHINVDNAMGTKGELVRTMNGLLAEIWSGSFSVVSPSGFKKVLSRFAGQFHGYQQHDAQEALLVILNLLHEDLCKYEKKGVSQSPVSDLFQGTYRSQLTCDTCHAESTMFEPFLNLALPVPEKETRKLNATFFPLAGQPVHIAVRVSKSGNRQHLFHRAAHDVLQMPGLEKSLVGVQLSGHSCYEIGPQKLMSSFRHQDLVLLYETRSEAEGWRSHFIFSYQVGRRQQSDSKHGSFSDEKRLGSGGRRQKPRHGSMPDTDDGTDGHRPHAFGVPVAVAIHKDDTGALALQRIAERITSVVGGVNVNPRAIKVVKFGGQWDEANPVPLQSVLEPTTSFGIMWGGADADLIARRFEEIPKDASCARQPADEEMTVPLSACFELSAAPDSLTVADRWFCPTCKEPRNAVKTMAVWKAPPVLCIQLKRFKMDFHSREKLHTLVEFPEELNLSKFVAGDVAPKGNYRLAAVSNHVGGLSGGHYTAHARIDGKWYEFDDRQCREIKSFRSVVSQSAYVLFYVSDDASFWDLPSPMDPDAVANPETAQAEANRPEPLPESLTKKKRADKEAVARDATTEDEEAVKPQPPPPVDEEMAALADSAYLCDICQIPVAGGWLGLTRHAKEVHDVDY